MLVGRNRLGLRGWEGEGIGSGLVGRLVLVLVVWTLVFVIMACHGLDVSLDHGLVLDCGYGFWW